MRPRVAVLSPCSRQTLPSRPERVVFLRTRYSRVRSMARHGLAARGEPPVDRTVRIESAAAAPLEALVRWEARRDGGKDQ